MNNFTKYVEWKKRGILYCPDGHDPQMLTHAQVPTAESLSSNIIRVYFGTRDKYQRTVTGVVDLQAEQVLKVARQYDEPALGLGEIGTFDDSGAMPSWIVTHEGKKYLYYTGWNRSTSVPYRNAIGLAVSEDGGLTFSRLYTGPVLDRSILEPYFCSQPCVMNDRGCWRMWYISCVAWHEINGKPEPRYNIKYAESKDGVLWSPQQITCIDFASDDEGGIARPCVIKSNNDYIMWYSYRKIAEYRTHRDNSYRIGYAVSGDGLSWRRLDDHAGIDVSEDGWDSQMVAYPFVLNHENCYYLFYNGNGFGSGGFGYAQLPVI